MVRSFRLAWPALVLTVACSSPKPTQEDCGPAHATFRLIVDAEEGPVPGDVRIHVRSGSGQESFDAREPDVSLKEVFCSLQREGQGDGGTAAPIRQVECDLWTHGAATVRVEASGYPEVERVLEAERDDECGLLLTKAWITLAREPGR